MVWLFSSEPDVAYIMGGVALIQWGLFFLPYVETRRRQIRVIRCHATYGFVVISPMFATVSPFFIDGTPQMYKHHAGGRRAGFIDRLAEVVGHVADFHSRFNIGSALHQRIENPRLVAGHGINFRQPYRMFHHAGRAGSIFR